MLNRLFTLSLVTLLAGTLFACTSGKRFDVTQVNFSLTPQSVIADLETSRGKQALWGGTILDTVNLKDNTQIEVLAYPLDSLHRPQLDKAPLGRFIIEAKGYLESATYAQGRQLSVLGDVVKLQSGKIGERDYNYPVLSSQQLHVWPTDESRSQSRFHFGIGIGIHN